LEKSIIDNELALVNYLVYLDENKLNSSEISTVGLSNDYNDLDNLPSLSDFVTKTYVDTSVNTLKNYIDSSLQLSSTYVKSSSTGTALNLEPNDRYEIAFGKLEKSMSDLSSDTSFVTNRFVNWGKIVTVENLSSTLTIDAYKIYMLGTVTQNVTITMDTTTEIQGYSAEYTIIFDASSGCSITLPNNCLYANGVTPVYVSGRTYEMNIMNNLVVVSSFYQQNS